MASTPRRAWLPWVIGLVGVAISAAGASTIDRLEERNERLLADDEVSTRTAAFEGDMRDAMSLLLSIKAVFDASAEVTREEFSTLARTLVPRTATATAIAWLPRVPRANRQAFEASIRQTGMASFVIYDRLEQGQPIQPAADRDEHYPVLFLEPHDPNRAPPGFDPGGTQRRLEALQRAVDTASTAADRVADPTFPAGWALDIVGPVFTAPTPPDAVLARRAALRGFVGVHMDLDLLVNVSLTRVPRRLACNTWLLDEQGRPLFSRIERGEFPAAPVTAASLRQGHYFERVVQVADRSWTLIFHPETEVGGVMPLDSSLLVLALGLAVTALVALSTSRLQTSGARLERLVEERTRDLGSTTEQLQQAQKMEAVGRLTGGIAHDFNNLLTIIIGNVSLARDAVTDSHVQHSLLEPALKAAERGAELTRRLLAFSRRQALQPCIVRIPELVRSMRTLVERTLGGAITIEVREGERVWPVMVDPSQLENTLLNLCINARDAMPRGGAIVITVENTSLGGDTPESVEVTPGDYVMVAVADAGEGMTEAVRARAFEPFFTTKSVGQGSGLGLSMVFGFVKQSQGHISLESQPGEGTTVRLYFPRAKEPQP